MSAVNIPVAYTYEAGVHCPDCTARRFGKNDSGYIALTNNGRALRDNEGNEVCAIFLWSEYHDDYCEDCHQPIGEQVRW